MKAPDTVTITGADDAVDPRALADLSAEFPFVEWGILLSPSRQGAPRYPSPRWRDELVILCGAAAAARRLRLSLHLCGEAARDTMRGASTWLLDSEEFARVQINGYESSAVALMERVVSTCRQEFVLQARDAKQLGAALVDAMLLRYDALLPPSVLYDPSGGTGTAPRAWPPPVRSTRVGYAGGIGPDSVEAVVESLGERGSYWIDMESGVRTADALDLLKVREVLSRVARLRAPCSCSGYAYETPCMHLNRRGTVCEMPRSSAIHGRQPSDDVRQRQLPASRGVGSAPGSGTRSRERSTAERSTGSVGSAASRSTNRI